MNRKILSVCAILVTGALMFPSCKKEVTTPTSTQKSPIGTPESLMANLREIGAQFHKEGEVRTMSMTVDQALQLSMMKALAGANANLAQEAGVLPMGNYYATWTIFIAGRQGQAILDPQGYNATNPAMPPFVYQSPGQSIYEDQYSFVDDLMMRAANDGINVTVTNNSFSPSVPAFLAGLPYFGGSGLNAYFLSNQASLAANVASVTNYISPAGFDFNAAITNSPYLTSIEKDVLSEFFSTLSTIEPEDRPSYMRYVENYYISDEYYKTVVRPRAWECPWVGIYHNVAADI